MVKIATPRGGYTKLRKSVRCMSRRQLFSLILCALVVYCIQNNVDLFGRNDGKQCAIILYGLPRSFDTIVLPALEKNVITPNLRYQCDYFVHVLIKDYDELPSFPEKSDFVNTTMLQEIEKTIDRVAMENKMGPPIVRYVSNNHDTFPRRQRDFFLKTFLLRDKGGHWLYFPELIREWGGLEMAWDLMESTQNEFDKRYDQVAIFRNDVAYLSPINIYSGDKKGLNIGQGRAASETKTKTSINNNLEGRSYFAYGPFDAVKIWSTTRFDNLEDYLNMLVKKSGLGMKEDEFLSEMIVPALAKSHFSVTHEPTTYALDVLPRDSILMGDLKINRSMKQRVEKVTHRQCKNVISSKNNKQQFLSCKEKKRQPLLKVVKKTKTAVICAIAKSEEAYLDEWVDYHLGIGFNHIFIYDNSDDFDLGRGWLERRPRLNGKATVIHFPGQKMQPPAYKHCVQKNVLKNGHQWVAFFDTDEMLVMFKHSNVVDFLSDHCKRGALSINWQIHSWNHRMQYSPFPFSKRFQGVPDGLPEINFHVKSISNANALDASAEHHPHFPPMKKRFTQIDTSGNELVDEKFFNKNYPNDVALIFHHHTKSWKEYIDKRKRGRPTMSGPSLEASVKFLIEEAKKGKGFHNTSSIDSSAWDRLKLNSNKYQFFDSLEHHPIGRIDPLSGSPLAICCVVSNQEAYIDEWAHYHIALGFSAIYIYDSSEDFWMRQWGQEITNKTGAHVFVTHFPGNFTDVSYKGKAQADCLSKHSSKHFGLAIMDVNDFFMVPGGNVEALVQDSKLVCAKIMPRVLFGNAGRFVYEPLPVTKRFMFRAHGNDASIPPSLFFLTSFASNNTEANIWHDMEHDIHSYHQSGVWKSKICNSDSMKSESVAVYHYLRSKKECIKERGDSSLCNIEGSVEDEFGWEQVQKFLPIYSNYNSFL